MYIEKDTERGNEEMGKEAEKERGDEIPALIN